MKRLLSALFEKRLLAVLLVLVFALTGCFQVLDGDDMENPNPPIRQESSGQTNESSNQSEEASDQSGEKSDQSGEKSDQSGDLADQSGETSGQIEETSGQAETSKETENILEEEMVMKLMIGETEVPVTWEENASVEALKELLPLTIQMSMYGGFEQVGPIGQSIVRDDAQTVTDAGDIVLYSGNQIVIFYGSNSWAYTRLGHIDLSAEEMAKLLSNGNVEIRLYLS